MSSQETKLLHEILNLCNGKVDPFQLYKLSSLVSKTAKNHELIAKHLRAVELLLESNLALLDLDKDNLVDVTDTK